MKKQSLFTVALVVLMSMIGAKSFAHDIAVANADGVTIYYVWTNNKTELAVSCRGSSYNSYDNEYSGSVDIPEFVEYNGNKYSVTSIGESAFDGCSSLTSVTIPSSVASIGRYAFYGSNLSSVTIPKSMTSIDQYAFSGCSSLTQIKVDSGNKIFDSRNDCNAIITTSTNILKRGCKNTIIPNSVTSIGASAFSGSGLTSITIPQSVTSIGDYAFSSCSRLASFTIPNSITSLGNYIFYSCENLITIKSEIEKPFEVKDDNFFNYQYDKLSTSNLTLIVPAGTKNAYQSTNGWKWFGKIVESGEGGIAGAKFEVDGVYYTVGENNIVSITSVNNSVPSVLEIPNEVTFNGASYSVTSISDNAFSKCTRLKSVKIPNSVKSIGASAFQDCSNLMFANIPNLVTSINSSTFSGCSNLSSVIIGSGVTSIASGAFGKLIKVIWLTNTPPEGYKNVVGTINYVSNDLFSALKGRVIKYPFLSTCFDVDGIRYVPISPSERTCDAIDCVYDESAANTKVSSTVEYKGITLNVKNINPYLAYNNKFIKTLSVDNDGELADYVFAYCSNMTSATLGNKVSSIGNNAFQGCSSLTSAILGLNVSAIGSYAFQACSSIETIDLPDPVPVLNVYTFADCTSLKEIKIKSRMTDIKNSVFYNCTSLSLVVFADSEEELNLGSNQTETYNYPYYKDYGDPLFSSCPLDSVYIGRNINYETSSTYGYSPFYRNLSLRAVRITDKETEISENEFYGCTNLQRVIIGDGVTIIKKWAFSDCSSLKFFAFGTQLETIEQEAFSDCASIVEISSKAVAPPVCGSQALDDINKWECKLYVPDGAMTTYQAADQWKDFFFTEEGPGFAGETITEIIEKKCETPTISIKDDELTFACNTNGVIFHYDITSSDVKGDITNNKVNLTRTYTITVYASKEGYNDSDVARADFKVSDTGLRGDLNKDGFVNAADHVELTKIILKQN